MRKILKIRIVGSEKTKGELHGKRCIPLFCAVFAFLDDDFRMIFIFFYKKI